MKKVGTNIFNQLKRESRQSRLRMNHNIHPEPSDPVQRMFNVIQPKSYVQPHRHPGTDSWELFLLMEGEGIALSFDEEGVVLGRVHLQMDGIRMVEIPPATYHTILALVPDSVFFEIKRGPYDPNLAKDFAAWSVPEGHPDQERAWHWFVEAKVGDRLELELLRRN